MIKFFIVLCCLLTAVFATGAYNRTSPAYARAETVIPSAGSVWRFGEEDYILFFENEVLERKVVSNMSDKKRDRLTAQYDVTDEQLNVLLCLQYALNTMDCYYSLDEMSKMSDTEILGLGLKYYAAYWPTLDGEKQAYLSAKLKTIG